MSIESPLVVPSRPVLVGDRIPERRELWQDIGQVLGIKVVVGNFGEEIKWALRDDLNRNAFSGLFLDLSITSLYDRRREKREVGKEVLFAMRATTHSPLYRPYLPVIAFSPTQDLSDPRFIVGLRPGDIDGVLPYPFGLDDIEEKVLSFPEIEAARRSRS